MESSSKFDPPSVLDGLNRAQREAVKHRGGPLLVLAGAGTGKTRVVTARIVDLIEEGAAADSILALTFTNKAALEMRSRVAAKLGEGVALQTTISTFHALGARLLRRFATRLGRRPDFVIYDDDDQLALVKRALTELGLGQQPSWAREVCDVIDAAKGEGVELPPHRLPPELLSGGGGQVGQVYERLLRRANAFDFGDLVLRPAEVLRDDPPLAASFRERWPHLLVDEYQDTNGAQLLALDAFAPPSSSPDLCVVGDDDQAIYGWRGARVENILRFAEVWSGARTIRLEENYRSTGHILDAANAVIAQNSIRLGKTLRTSEGAGHRLELRGYPQARDEARFVASRIRSLCREEGFSFADCAILFRNNALSLDLEDALRAERLPYVLVRGRSFYERAEVRDALSWARLLANRDDDVALRRAVSSPPRGIGATTLDALTTSGAQLGCSMLEAAGRLTRTSALKKPARLALVKLIDDIEQARAIAAAEPIQALLTVLEPLCRALGLSNTKASENAARLDNIQRLLDALHSHLEAHPGSGLTEWLEQVRLVSDADGLDTSGGAVSMTTIHAAKGLEFPVVFVVGVEEGLFPSRRGERSGEVAAEVVEEERRLFYVAATRARRRLFLTFCRERRTFGETRPAGPSRFIAEVPAAHVEPYVTGDPSRPAPLASGWATGRARTAKSTTTASSASSHDDHLYADPVYDDPAFEVSSFQPGRWVWHADLGRGLIKSVRTGARGSVSTLVVDFPGRGARTVVSTYVSPYDPAEDSPYDVDDSPSSD